MLGTLCDGELVMDELHRFPSAMCEVGGTWRWDVIQVFEEIKRGLAVAGARGLRIDSISTDSWGVDYVLTGAGEPLLTLPYHYRDGRTEDDFSELRGELGDAEIFERTGLQFMNFNTLYQLRDDVVRRREVLEVAGRFLNIADYMNWLLSGVAKAEVSMASTTQLYDPRARDWAWGLAERAGIPERLFPEIVASGTVLGPLDPALAESAGLAGVQVVASCSHDTGAAVVAVPAEGSNWAYLSSGTWSLVGVELADPLISDAVRQLNFTNEVGFGHTSRFLKNKSGLWLLQECRRQWEAGGRETSYEALVGMAAAVEPLRILINPDEREFASPGRMLEKISGFCERHGEPVPATQGEVVRCILDSLALMYGHAIREVEELTGVPIRRIHIVGGGSQNDLLNQCAADATGCEVLAGPVEATAMGNVLVQAMALGRVGSIEGARRIVGRSTEVKTFRPGDRSPWEAALPRFERLIS